MDTKFDNWIEQDRLYGLDYSSAKTSVGSYKFDIRYDCDMIEDTIKPENCDVWLTIYYKDKKIYSCFGKTVESMKLFSETWFNKEVSTYVRKHCTNHKPLPTNEDEWFNEHEAFVTEMKINNNETTYEHLQKAFNWFKKRYS